jgi:hypothetical protein
MKVSIAVPRFLHRKKWHATLHLPDDDNEELAGAMIGLSRGMWNTFCVRPEQIAGGTQAPRKPRLLLDIEPSGSS